MGESYSDETRQTALRFAERAAASLNRELTSAGLFIPEGHGMTWRVKTQAAIRAKRQRAQAINDFIGMRVLTAHVGMIVPLVENLSGWEMAIGLERARVDSSFDERDESGFRSVHIDYVCSDSGITGLPPGTTVELQVTTWLQHLHGCLSHQLFYKATPDRGTLAPAVLHSLSERLVALDKEVAAIMCGARMRE